MYLTVIALGLVVCYFLLRFLFPFMFGGEIKPLTPRSCYSIVLIFVLSLIVNFAVRYIPNVEIGNRILHAVGGGFLTFLLCFLVVKDGEYRLGRVRFFVFSFLLVVFLGVVNEHVEFILQHFFGYLAANSVLDTWLDLISNSVGTLLASICFVPFINSEKKL
jgi:hypothetical protein